MTDFPLAEAIEPDEDARVVDVVEPELAIAVSRTATTPEISKLRIDFDDSPDVDRNALAKVLELLAKLARRGKAFEITVKVIE